MADGGDEYDNKGGPRRWDKPAPLLPSLLALGAPSSSTAAARGKLSMSSSLSSGASSRQSSPARSTAPAAEPGPAGTQAHHPKKRKLDLGDDGAARPLSSIPRPQPLQSKPLETAQSRIPSAAGRPVRQSIARPTIVPSAAAGLLATSRPESRSRIFPQPTPDNNPFLTGPTSGTTASARTTPTSATRVFAPGERLLKVELAERDEKIRALQDELAKLKKKADRSSPQKASVETAPPQQAADVAALKAELDAARIELKRLEVERQIQDDNIEDLNEKLDGLTGLQSVGLVSANDSTPEVERLQTMVIDLEREVAKAKADKSEMARALDEAKEKALHAAAERDAVSGKCKLELLRAEGFVREQRVKIEALEKAAEDSAESVLVAQQRVTELSEELKSVENRLASKEQESKSLSDEVAKLKEDLEQQSMKLATLEDPANRVPPAAFLRLPIPLDTMPDLSTMKWALTKICAQYYRIQTQHEEHLFEMAEALASEMAAVVDEKEPAEDLLLSPVLDVEDLPEVVEIAAPLSSEKCELSGQLDAPESQAKDDQIQVDSLKTMVAQLQDEIQSMKSLQAHAEQGTLRAKRLASVR
ncbi:hypothetical protein DFJ73DRAFT_519490 [Zopfochytrium polystomum]|nr:hypothetical protein DFJ73DRAFT_519490 [Zopfochytrium polystomum]